MWRFLQGFLLLYFRFL
ncbi:hypothetical protein LINPERPRIM_LOCUS21975 [Linum perenne]